MAAVVVAALWLWFSAEPAPAPMPEPPRAAQAKEVPARRPLPALRKRTTPAPRNELPEREALLAAVRERSATLKACVVPEGTLARLPLRLHVGKAGAMKAVDFTVEPPSAIASCVRKTAMMWSFEGVNLSSDVDLLVSVSFQPTM